MMKKYLINLVTLFSSFCFTLKILTIAACSYPLKMPNNVFVDEGSQDIPIGYSKDYFDLVVFSDLNFQKKRNPTCQNRIL